MNQLSERAAALSAVLQAGEGWIGEGTLCRMLGHSRPELMAAVAELQGEGFPVRSVHGLGVRWKPWPEEYDLAELAALSGMKVCLFDQTGSTNDVARQLLAQGEAGPVLVVADAQTAGRGRMGRAFSSPAGTGIYMSLLLTDQRVLTHSGLITAAASVLVGSSIQKLTGVRPRIKWINDLYLEGGKLCGILTEGVAGGESGTLSGVIVGIGINFRTDLSQLPQEVAETAATLADRLPMGLTRSDLICSIARGMVQKLPVFLESRSFLPEYRRQSCVLGRRVRVLPAGGDPYEALAVAIDEDAALIVEGPQGRQRLATGEISIRFLEKEDLL